MIPPHPWIGAVTDIKNWHRERRRSKLKQPVKCVALIWKDFEKMPSYPQRAAAARSADPKAVETLLWCFPSRPLWAKPPFQRGQCGRNEVSLSADEERAAGYISDAHLVPHVNVPANINVVSQYTNNMSYVVSQSSCLSPSSKWAVHVPVCSWVPNDPKEAHVVPSGRWKAGEQLGRCVWGGNGYAAPYSIRQKLAARKMQKMTSRPSERTSGSLHPNLMNIHST